MTEPTIVTAAQVAETLPADVAAAITAEVAAEPEPDLNAAAGCLTLAAALAELDRATPGMLEAEARHGFTFGGPVETGPGRHAAAVTCATPTCERFGRHVQILTDTVLPVHCGGCGAVLHCDHAPELTRTRTGTIGAPLEVTVTACGTCGTELGRVERPLPPIDLNSLPVAVLDQTLDRA